MNAGEADRSPFNRAWIPRDVRFVLDAFLATAIGTMGGLLVDSGFGLRASVINFVYALLHPVFGLLADFPIAQLVVAEFVYRVPVVLIVGMLAGLVLRHVRYRGLLLWSIAVWPACLLSGTAAAFLVARKHAGDAATAIPRIGSFSELFIYVLQYLLLVAVILAAEAAVARAAGRPPAR
jgi:hypothetical protein